MGYYSEVRYLVIGEKEVMTTMLAAWRLTDKDAATQLDEVVIVPYKESMLLLSFHMGNGKWYDNYSDVAMHTRFLNFTEDYEVQGVFLRVGEDDTDIETGRYGLADHDLHQYVHISRSIYCDIDVNPGDDIRETKNEPDALPAIPESEGAVP